MPDISEVLNIYGMEALFDTEIVLVLPEKNLKIISDIIKKNLEFRCLKVVMVKNSYFSYSKGDDCS